MVIAYLNRDCQARESVNTPIKRDLTIGTGLPPIAKNHIWLVLRFLRLLWSLDEANSNAGRFGTFEKVEVDSCGADSLTDSANA